MSLTKRIWKLPRPVRASRHEGLTTADAFRALGCRERWTGILAGSG